MKAIIPAAARVKNMERHPELSVWSPPRVGPRAGATLIAIPTVPIATPRRDIGITENTAICSTGHKTPVPIASSIRPESIAAKVGPAHASIEPAINMAIDASTICLVVNLRVRKAVNGTITPITSWNTDVIHCPVVTLIWNSWTIVGSAEESWSWVKLPRNVIAVRTAREIKASWVRWPLL